MRYWLGVKHSYSRPRVSDDNAFSESLFRTAKYRPEFPAKGFATAASATSARRSVMPATITRSSQRVTRSTPRLASATLRGGRATPATGRPSAPSRSILNATRWSRRQRTTKRYSHWLHDRGNNYLDARRVVAALTAQVRSKARHPIVRSQPRNLRGQSEHSPARDQPNLRLGLVEYASARSFVRKRTDVPPPPRAIWRPDL
jgi:hypothetical protein